MSAAPARPRAAHQGRRDNPEGRMSLLEHLVELRRRLTISLLALGVGTLVAFFLWERLFRLLAHPYCQVRVARALGCQLFVFGVLDAFLVRMQVALLAGAVLSSPVWLYQLWAFITPGLRRNERKWAIVFISVSMALFAIGAAFAYFTLGRGLQFLLGIGGNGVAPLLDVRRYLSFLTLMLLAFGVSFEFPLLIVCLNFAGVLTAERLRSWRRGMYFGLAFFAAVITPSQDPFTFLAMTIPLWVFYEACVVIARVHDARKHRRAAADPYAGLADDEPSPLDLDLPTRR
ncbi:MAG: twin-arginine translocase subunit TatC [Mycobacteriales bacterium]